eukprot:GILK01009168.1.p1 GENE.GILK01009168.1~~GILK01009168.1.p1  ORF type:complete len:833 (+),score=89.95 GILK01009168.1:51-2501(+)
MEHPLLQETEPLHEWTLRGQGIEIQEMQPSGRMLTNDSDTKLRLPSLLISFDAQSQSLNKRMPLGPLAGEPLRLEDLRDIPNLTVLAIDCEQQMPVGFFTSLLSQVRGLDELTCLQFLWTGTVPRDYVETLASWQAETNSQSSGTGMVTPLRIELKLKGLDQWKEYPGELLDTVPLRFGGGRVSVYVDNDPVGDHLSALFTQSSYPASTFDITEIAYMETDQRAQKEKLTEWAVKLASVIKEYHISWLQGSENPLASILHVRTFLLDLAERCPLAADRIEFVCSALIPTTIKLLEPALDNVDKFTMLETIARAQCPKEVLSQPHVTALVSSCFAFPPISKVANTSFVIDYLIFPFHRFLFSSICYFVFFCIAQVLFFQIVQSDNHEPSRNLSILFGIWIVAFAFYELCEMLTTGMTYFLEIWNFLDISISVLALCGVCSSPTTAIFFYGVLNALLWLRLLNVFSIFTKFGMMIQAMLKMMIDVVMFLAIYGVILLAFACIFTAYFAAFPNENDTNLGFNSLSWSLYTLFMATFGDFNLLTLLDDSLFFPAVLLMIYVIMGPILLLNLLIAIMNTSFSDVSTAGCATVNKAKIQMTMTYRQQYHQNILALPPPFNLLFVPLAPFILLYPGVLIVRRISLFVVKLISLLYIFPMCFIPMSFVFTLSLVRRCPNKMLLSVGVLLFFVFFPLRLVGSLLYSICHIFTFRDLNGYIRLLDGPVVDKRALLQPSASTQKAMRQILQTLSFDVNDKQMKLEKLILDAQGAIQTSQSELQTRMSALEASLTSIATSTKLVLEEMKNGNVFQSSSNAVATRPKDE